MSIFTDYTGMQTHAALGSHCESLVNAVLALTLGKPPAGPLYA